MTQLSLKDLRALPDPFRVATVVGIGLLVLGAVCLFHYTQLLNRKRIAIARGVWENNVSTAAEDWKNRFATDKTRTVRLYQVGQWSFGIGAIALGVVIAKLLLTS